jgi:hypothetical protein
MARLCERVVTLMHVVRSQAIRSLLSSAVLVTRSRVACASYALLGTALVANGSHGQAPSKPIFRYIDIAPCGRIELGTRFDPSGRAVRQNDTTFRLIPHCFGDADQILVHVGARQRVTSFDFSYGVGDSLATHDAYYRTLIGAPFAVDTTGPGVHTVQWRDSTTILTLFRNRRGFEVRSYARLADRLGSTK